MNLLRPHITSRSRGNGYGVAGVGVDVPTFPTREAAEKWLEEHYRSLPTERRPQHRACMCCGTSFLSMGFHNRLCDRCRYESDVLVEEARPRLPRARGR